MYKYGLSFYLQYLARWPEYFQVAESPTGEIMGYSACCSWITANIKGGFQFFVYVLVMGKAEGRADSWHGHVTALTVAPEFRRLGLAGQFMQGLEDISER